MHTAEMAVVLHAQNVCKCLCVQKSKYVSI